MNKTTTIKFYKEELPLLFNGKSKKNQPINIDLLDTKRLPRVAFMPKKQTVEKILAYAYNK
ncbi:MAG: hypothetical protein IPO14_01170 [Saprospiraceae bacterium]|nr:hypothetical protein [Saprospiraceae bacterium]